MCLSWNSISICLDCFTVPLHQTPRTGVYRDASPSAIQISFYLKTKSSNLTYLSTNVFRMCVNVHATPITRCGLLPALGQQVKRTPSGHERTSGAYHSGHSKIVYVTVLGVSHPRASAMLHPGTLRATSSISDGQWLFFCLGYQLCEETLGVNSVINPNNLWVSTM